MDFKAELEEIEQIEREYNVRLKVPREAIEKAQQGIANRTRRTRAEQNAFDIARRAFPSELELEGAEDPLGLPDSNDDPGDPDAPYINDLGEPIWTMT